MMIDLLPETLTILTLLAVMPLPRAMMSPLVSP
jgi:hypothetical protein